jgi:hypothetical protein
VRAGAAIAIAGGEHGFDDALARRVLQCHVEKTGTGNFRRLDQLRQRLAKQRADRRCELARIALRRLRDRKCDVRRIVAVCRCARALDGHSDALAIGQLLADDACDGRLNQLLRRDYRRRVATRFVRHIDGL